MDVQLLTLPPKEFQPIEVKLTITNIQEARLLFHVLNNNNLWGDIKDYTVSTLYDLFVASTFTGGGYEVIKEEIQRQGFEL